jgi:hypothetical protein
VSFAPQIRADQLDGHDAIDEDVPGSINDAHAAFTDARLQTIAAGDHTPERRVFPFSRAR